MVEEQKLEERAQAVKRLRSLFDMHKVAFGASVNLRGMLLNLHHDRHFSMDFWSVVNTFSEGGGSGSLTEEEMFEAVLESVTGVTSVAMPSYERPAVVELSQMIGGVDVMRPADEPLEPVEPLPPIANADDLPAQQSMVAKQPASADLRPATSSEDQSESGERRRSIGEALARLEQTTRELREQLAQIASPQTESIRTESMQLDSQLPVENLLSEPLRAEAEAPALREKVRFVEEPPRAVAAPQAVQAPPPLSQTPLAGEAEDDEEQAGSPLAEAHPPHRFIDVVPSEPRPSAASMHAEPAPASQVRWPNTKRVFVEPDSLEPGPLSSPLEQIRPPAAGNAAPAVAAAPAVSKPVPVFAPAPASGPVAPAAAAAVEAEVFEPRPPHMLSQRGLAVPPPLDEDEVHANPPSFGRYGEEPETTSHKGAIAAVLLLLLGAGAYAGSRTEQGKNLLGGARQWVQSTYHSISGHGDDNSSPASPEPAPTSQPATPAETHALQAAATTPSEPAASAASQPPPTTKASDEHAADRPETTRTTRHQPFVDDSVLRVPSATMAGNLISSRTPVYPPAAISQQVEGVVTVDMIVGSNGIVKFAKAIDGDRLLQSAAEEAVLRWRYKPYVFNGEAVSVSTMAQVRFRLPYE